VHNRNPFAPGTGDNAKLILAITSNRGRENENHDGLDGNVVFSITGRCREEKHGHYPQRNEQ
jgi:hypothetical protein